MKETPEVLRECLSPLKPKKVLDLGIGNARCSKRFLEKNVRVIGVDIKKADLPEEIDFILQDLRNFDFPERYNLIIASLGLHFLKKQISQEIIQRMQAATLKNGYNFILFMNPKEENAQLKIKQGWFYISLEEIKKIYSGWEIIKSGSYETPLEKHDNLPEHKHNLSFILARK